MRIRCDHRRRAAYIVDTSTAGHSRPRAQRPDRPAPAAHARDPATASRRRRRRGTGRARPVTRDSEVVVAVLLPDLLGTYSDAGNAEVLAQRLRWRGIPARVTLVPASQPPPTGADLYLLGGGEDTAQDSAARWLHRHRAALGFVAEHAVTLAVCAGLQLLGNATWDRAGTHRPGLGLLDLHTVPAASRQLGEAVSRCHLDDVGRLTGFHNHGGVSVLGDGADRLATVLRGPGNHPDGSDDGAVRPARPLADTLTDHRSGPGIVATYMHGPVLARNPRLADHLLTRAVGRALPALDAERLPDLDRLRRRYLDDPADRGLLGRRLRVPRARPATPDRPDGDRTPLSSGTHEPVPTVGPCGFWWSRTRYAWRR